MEDKLVEIVNYYGINKQLKYIHSEYYELDEAILECEHSYHYSPTQLGRTYKNHIAEEIADVMVMLKQFQYYYDISDEQIKKITREKVERQLERIKNEK